MTRPLTVIHAIPDLRLSAGGIAGTIAPLNEALRRQGVRNIFITAEQDAEGALGEHTHRVSLNSRIFQFRRSVRILIERVVLSAAWDGAQLICHSHGLWSPINHFVVHECRRRGIPVVISPHGMLMPWARAHKALRKCVAWSLYQKRDIVAAEAIHVTSDAEAEILDRVIVGKNIVVAPLGVEVPASIERPRHYGLSRRQQQLLFLGRLHPIKNLESLIAAFADTRPANWKLRIVGPDESNYGRALRREIDRLRLSEFVTVEAPVYGLEKSQLLASVDALILPSHSENYGLVVAEALAFGCPVIATRGTPWSILETEGCGWWVNSDRSSLAASLRTLSKTPRDQLRQMGVNGRRFVDDHLSWRGCAKNLTRLYTQIAATGQDSPQ